MCIIMSYNLYKIFICYMVKSKLIPPFGQPRRLIRVMIGAPLGVELACTTAKPLNLFSLRLFIVYIYFLFVLHSTYFQQSNSIANLHIKTLMTIRGM